MIKLTHATTGSTAYVSPEHVTDVIQSERVTRIYMGSIAPLEVKESPEAVVRLITEAKHRKMKLQAAYIAANELLTGDSSITVINLLEAEDMP